MFGPQKKRSFLTSLMSTLLFGAPMIAAAGWAFLTWVLGGGAGLAILVFIVMKVLGK